MTAGQINPHHHQVTGSCQRRTPGAVPTPSLGWPGLQRPRGALRWGHQAVFVSAHAVGCATMPSRLLPLRLAPCHAPRCGSLAALRSCEVPGHWSLWPRGRCTIMCTCAGRLAGLAGAPAAQQSRACCHGDPVSLAHAPLAQHNHAAAAAGALAAGRQVPGPAAGEGQDHVRMCACVCARVFGGVGGCVCVCVSALTSRGRITCLHVCARAHVFRCYSSCMHAGSIFTCAGVYLCACVCCISLHF